MDKNLWNASVFLSSASFYIIIMWSRRAETSKTQHTGSRKLIDGKIYIYIGKNCQLYRVNFKEVNWQLTKTFASQSKSKAKNLIGTNRIKLYRNIFPWYLKGGQKEKKIIWFMRKSISMMQKKRRMNNQFSEKEEWKTWRRKKNL